MHETFKPVNLQPHLEGGSYRLLCLSEIMITTEHNKQVPAMSHIYFELQPGEVSKLHFFGRDELWNLYRGAGVYLYLWEGPGHEVRRVELSAAEEVYAFAVPGNVWIGAEPIGPDAVLTGCTVAPAFDYADFKLLRADAELAHSFKVENPELAYLV